jgi:hypothetical protein
MAEGDGAIYNNFKEQVMEGVFNLLTDTLKIALVTAHVPDIDADDAWAAASPDEVTGTGYTAGGLTLTAVTVTQDDANDRGIFDAANATWTGLNIGGASGSPSHAILYDDTVIAPADALIAYWEVTTASNGGNYTLQFNAVGIITIT